MYKIVKFNKVQQIGGFTVKPGFLGIVNPHGRLIAVSSGMSQQNFQDSVGMAYIYYRTAPTGWTGEWVYATIHYPHKLLTERLASKILSDDFDYYWKGLEPPV